MVKIFIYLLLALGIGAYLSILLMDDPGYVLITFWSYSLEASLATMIISLFIIYVLLYGLFRFLHLANPLKLLQKSTWLKLFSPPRARQSSEKGLQLLLLGHWQDAYKKLVESADGSQVPAFNYLAAAYAAFQRHDQLAFNFCLSQAKQHSPAARTGIKAFQAELEHQAGRQEQSLALLLAVRQEQPDSPHVLFMLKDIYLGLKDWDKLSELIPALEKARIVSNEELVLLKEHLAIHHLHKQIEKHANAKDLKSLWQQFSKVIQKRELVMEAYLRALLSINETTEVELLLMKFLRRQWSERLIILLGYIDTADAPSLLLRLEGWLKNQPSNVPLMLTLGRLSLRNRLWRKGREYFEFALRFSESRELSAQINSELGRLLEHLGEYEASLQYYRQAMGFLEIKLPELPMPKPAHRGGSASTSI